jgi:hypothetical protein
VIPARIRSVFGLDSDFIEIFSENDLICIRKADESDVAHQPYDTSKVAHRLARNQGTSSCNRCICSSCTGFGCPWVAKVYRYEYSLKLMSTERCRICSAKNIGMIHDCDFYTPRKRKKFYKPKIIRKESKHDILMRELADLKKMLERLRE